MARFFLLLSLALRADSAEVVFRGALERVGTQSITIKLADRREIDARLPTKPRFELKAGDIIEMTCKAVHSTWDEETSGFQSLEVTRIRLMEGEPLVRAGNTVSKLPEEWPQLARARKVNLEYA